MRRDSGSFYLLPTRKPDDIPCSTPFQMLSGVAQSCLMKDSYMYLHQQKHETRTPDVTCQGTEIVPLSVSA